MDTDASAPRAAETLEPRLDPARMTPVARLGRTVLAFTASAFGFGGEDALPGFDLVVTRIETGAEVLRVRAGQFEEAERLLQATRKDLTTMTVGQFVREWRVVVDE